jgi:hypothetical protein
VPRWALQCVLAAALTSALVSCGSGTGAGRADAGEPTRVEDRLEQIAAGAARPIYYLGQRFRGWPLVDAMDDGAGRVDAIYGTCDPDPDSCAPPIDLINEALDLVKWGQAVGCSRLPPVRGVPAVHFGDALVLLTGVSLITVGVLADDTRTAIAAAEQLRAVGTDGPVQALPQPDPAALRVLTIACGQQPGDAGPTLSEPGGDAAQDVHVPDFTVERLGGGTLRWAAYGGKPVVVVVGDVPDVVAGIRRVTELRAGGSPAVIGLVWKPFGLKTAPAPIEQIESEAGNLSVPVGYAAIPRPAVWFFDIAEASAVQTGVIAFVNADGDLIRHLRTDAPDDAIVLALGLLRR